MPTSFDMPNMQLATRHVCIRWDTPTYNIVVGIGVCRDLHLLQLPKDSLVSHRG